MLVEAFNLDAAKQLVAFVGGGGKTSLMFRLAAALGAGVVTTTTTRIFAAQMKLAPAVCFLQAQDVAAVTGMEDGPGKEPEMGPISRLGEFLQRDGTCLVVGEVQGEKAFGVPPALPAQLLARADVRHVLVEADGSRMRPIKAPAAHEPVIPPQATRVVPVVGMDALERPLAAAAHRPQQVQAVLGKRFTVSGEQFLTPEMVAALLTDARGGLKVVPAGAQVIPVLNKVEGETRLVAARRIARHVLRNRQTAAVIPQVVLSAVRSGRPIREVQRRVTAVVLAAGQSRRMGEVNKLLLPWGVRTVLGQTLAHVGETAVFDTLLVTGHDAAAVSRLAADYGVTAVHNAAVAAGGEMITSLQAALRHLPEYVAAVLVVLGDQPMVPAAVLDRLLHAYWQGKGRIVAPAYDGQRGNPVLIDRRFFAELLALPPQAAPRHVLRRHPQMVDLVRVDTPAILQDLDRFEDYERLRP